MRLRVGRVTGVMRWRHETSDVVHAAPVAGHGLIFIGGFDGILYALRPEMGRDHRHYAQDGRGHEAEERLLRMGSIASNPASRGTMVCFGTTEGVLYAPNLAGF